MKREQYKELEELPNIGPAIAADLRLIGVSQPKDLLKQDPYALYKQLCRKTQRHHDPCVLDVFISAVRFMHGAPKRPWWAYTAERKRALVDRSGRI
jgi:hypothetical protein